MAHISGMTMMIDCPKCSVVVEIANGKWRFAGGPCEELAGTKYAEEAEYQWCPVLDDAMPAEWKLLTPHQREVVQAEIANAREARL
jgi:hypothetical protein